MNLPPMRLDRDVRRADVTFGKLYVDAGYFSEILEEPWRENAPCVSCIPDGVYPYRVSHSPKFRRALIEIMDVPGREHIRMHAGNTVRDTEGCMLFGTIRGELGGQPAVLGSRDREDAMRGLLLPILRIDPDARGEIVVRWLA